MYIKLPIPFGVGLGLSFGDRFYFEIMVIRPRISDDLLLSLGYGFPVYSETIR